MVRFAIFALCIALPAAAQDYGMSGDDELSWQQQDAPPQSGPAIGDFRNDAELDYNGQWVDSPGYGTVWQPTNVDPGWQPYVNGRWAWTADGWAWLSDEPFGWAVYHYGRWIYSDQSGWAWVPGRVWGPSWVAWRWGDGYAAWSPLGPGGAVADGRAAWVQVPARNFLDPVQQRVVPMALPLAGSPVHRGPHAGPPRRVVEQATGQPVRRLAIAEAPAPRAARASGGVVNFYRPHSEPVLAARGGGWGARPGQRVQPAAQGTHPRPAASAQSSPAREGRR